MTMLLLLLACGEKEEDTATEETIFTEQTSQSLDDQDGDGLVEEGDCNDEDAPYLTD